MGLLTSNSTRQIPIPSTSGSRKLACQLKNRLRSKPGANMTLPFTTRMVIALSSTAHSTSNLPVAIHRFRVEYPPGGHKDPSNNHRVFITPSAPSEIVLNRCYRCFAEDCSLFSQYTTVRRRSCNGSD